MRMLPLRLMLFVSLLATLGSVLYYVAPVTAAGLLGVVALSAIGACVIPFSAPETTPPAPLTRWSLAVGLVGVAGLAAWWTAVVGVRITDAVRSPWGLVDPFALAGIGVALFAALVLLARSARFGIALLVATLFSALSMAAVVYPLGFGFDPFLHRATIAHIATFGTITPKPMYYIGQYALELLFSLKGTLSLAAIDRFLLPVLATGMLTASTWYAFRSRIALAGLLLLPLSAFISTTPQGIAYVFALCAIVLTFPLGTSWLALALATASLITHPFAGIPAMLFVVASMVVARTTSRAWLALATLAATLAIPLVFALQAARAGLSLEAHLGNLFDVSRWSSLALTGFFSNHFSSSLDGIYLVVDNALWIVAALGIIGYVLDRRTVSPLPLLFAGAMFLNFLTLSIVFDFDFLISYERQDYAVRALTLAQLFLIPYVCIGIAELAQRLRSKPCALEAGFLALLAFIGTANVYGAYPRHDNYARSAGFNVSQADFDAVYAIAQQGGNQDYIVLSNQATAAAAVEAFGFAKYYHTDMFYYPIPTGGPLYQQYLTMVDDGPTRARMLEAMDMAGVDLGFFAVSDYWWQSEQIIENAKRIADDWFAVDNGKVTVFMFGRSL